MSNHTVAEKKMAKAILNIVSNAMIKAMDTIDAHEGRFMAKELKLNEALEEPKHKSQKRRYVHTATYWTKKLKRSKRK